MFNEKPRLSSAGRKLAATGSAAAAGRSRRAARLQEAQVPLGVAVAQRGGQLVVDGGVAVSLLPGGEDQRGDGHAAGGIDEEPQLAGQLGRRALGLAGPV